MVDEIEKLAGNYQPMAIICSAPLKILQSDWPITFWSLPREPEFWQIWITIWFFTLDHFYEKLILQY